MFLVFMAGVGRLGISAATSSSPRFPFVDDAAPGRGRRKGRRVIDDGGHYDDVEVDEQRGELEKEKQCVRQTEREKTQTMKGGERSG